MMMFFKPVVLGLVIACTFSLGSASESIRARRLSFSLVAGYEPQTLVTDHNALDLDQAAMEKELSKGAWSEAHHIYKDGAYSKNFADLTLTDALTKTIPMGSKVKGKSHSGGTAKGRTLHPAKSGDTGIQVQYHVHSTQDSYVDCQVGALWRVHEANLDGCFHQEGGSVEIEDFGTYNYTYDLRKDNKAARTLQLLSTTADVDMLNCEACPFPTFQKFFEYYGEADYGDQWVTAAFDSRATSFQNGNIDFSKANNQSRVEGIQKGTVNLNVYMAVIRKMEDAIFKCEKTGGGGSLNPWDSAVAFYSGSLEGSDGKGSGKFLHQLADKRCANFKTCGKDGDNTSGHAKVNHEIFQLFKFGQRDLQAGNCDGARENKERIESLMTIPMIQGTLRYAHIQENPDTANQKAAAEGATFAAAVLPIVHSCNSRAAEAIHENMNFGASSTSFYHVKNAFQEAYKCMGINCEDVGGYYDDASNDYFEGAAPCTGTGSSGGANAVGIAVGVTIAVVVVLAAAVFVARQRRMAVPKEPKKNPIFVHTLDEIPIT